MIENDYTRHARITTSNDPEGLAHADTEGATILSQASAFLLRLQQTGDVVDADTARIESVTSDNLDTLGGFERRGAWNIETADVSAQVRLRREFDETGADTDYFDIGVHLPGAKSGEFIAPQPEQLEQIVGIIALAKEQLGDELVIKKARPIKRLSKRLRSRFDGNDAA